VDPAITIEMLPVRLGDCLLVECHRPPLRPWRMLIDGGPPDCWPVVRERLARLPADDRRIDLVVVTHIDSDHIGGLLPLFETGLDAVPVGEVWFNGLDDHRRSAAQGEQLMRSLIGGSTRASLRWNATFGGLPVMTAEQGGFVEHRVADGPAVTVLSPTAKRLEILRRRWAVEAELVRRGEPSDAPEPPVPLEPLTALEALAERVSTPDQSAANGSSIALLVEHRGAAALFAADAFANVLGAALFRLAEHRGVPAVPVDAFKLPHHASKANVSARLVALAPARHYLVSTNGDRFHHPDDVALARVVVGAEPGAVLHFNYANARTDRWAVPRIADRYGITAGYPRTAAAGIRLELAGRAP
jgi:hypothetical protein